MQTKVSKIVFLLMLVLMLHTFSQSLNYFFFFIKNVTFSLPKTRFKLIL